MDGGPAEVRPLIGQGAAGNVSDLPPIEVVEGAGLPGAMCAYAISTGTIYLKGDWLVSASEEQVIAVLTEELGHHLDGLLNSSDTPGDEGEAFAQILLQINHPKLSGRPFAQHDSGTAIVHNSNIELEYSEPNIAFVVNLYDAANFANKDYEIFIHSYDGNLDFNSYTKKVALLIHGWQGKGISDLYDSFADPRISKLASQLSDAYHVLLLNWSTASKDPGNPPPDEAAGRIQKIAASTASQMLPFISHNLDLTLIGHSLGAIMASEIAKALPEKANVVSLDIAYPAKQYDLDNSAFLDNSNQTISNLSASSKSSLALVASDSGGYGFAGDNDFSETADLSFIVKFIPSELNHQSIVDDPFGAAEDTDAHGAIQDIYGDLLKYLSPSSLVYKWLFRSDSGDPLGIKYLLDSYDQDGNQPFYDLKWHDGVIEARKISDLWTIASLATKNVDIKFDSTNLSLAYVQTENDVLSKSITIDQRGVRVDFTFGSAVFDGDLCVSIGGRSDGDFDQITFLDSVSFNGYLKPTLINGFKPAANDEFSILRYQGKTGEFAINNNDLVIDAGIDSAELRFLPFYTDSELKLKVVANDGDAAFAFSSPPSSGTTVSAIVSINDPDGINLASLNYRWLRQDGGAWQTISNSSTYAITNNDEDKKLRFEVSYTDLDGFNESFVSDAAYIPIANSGNATFTVSGLPYAGQTLRANLVASDPDGSRTSAYRYYWQLVLGDNERIDTIITDTPTYKLTASDVGKKVSLMVNYIDDQGWGEKDYPVYDGGLGALNSSPKNATWQKAGVVARRHVDCCVG